MGFDSNSITQMANIISGFNQKRKVMTVNGIKEAQELKLNNGESILFLDSNDDILYLKQCDDIGKVTLRVFQCTDITDDFTSNTENNSISKADLETFEKNILNEVKKLIGGKNELDVK